MALRSPACCCSWRRAATWTRQRVMASRGSCAAVGMVMKVVHGCWWAQERTSISASPMARAA
eukprot:4601183-Prymnesium_polylepis.1